jgi:hypothetical protein
MRSETLLTLTLTLALGLIAATAAASETLDAMRWRRRVLLIAAPGPADPKAVLQRRIFDAWTREAADRDVSLVAVTGSRVEGASDTAASLRRRYRLKPTAFQVLLIGKDGHVALRSAQPIDAATLQSRIDAMPMRRAGER